MKREYKSKMLQLLFDESGDPKEIPISARMSVWHAKTEMMDNMLTVVRGLMARACGTIVEQKCECGETVSVRLPGELRAMDIFLKNAAHFAKVEGRSRKDKISIGDLEALANHMDEQQLAEIVAMVMKIAEEREMVDAQ